MEGVGGVSKVPNFAMFQLFSLSLLQPTSTVSHFVNIRILHPWGGGGGFLKGQKFAWYRLVLTKICLTNKQKVYQFYVQNQTQGGKEWNVCEKKNNIIIGPQLTMVYNNGVITEVEMVQFRGNVIKEISQQLNCCTRTTVMMVFILPPYLQGWVHYVQYF